ncbi:two pore domain potassium channel, EF-hand domain pair [Artemisia annua]|uniref:Two pore domain potassium channel, EF-hand domain pair n=1 Tax=Artemisia annua TaxID=35608 RepID=A0A2U1L5I7_ARTAN|nr:two pore domain potassium channel, EF-hand domain pair [Artemisia annua]
MEKEPLLQSHSTIPKAPSPLGPLHEQNEITIPTSLTPMEFKDMLIFGSSRNSSSTNSLTVDALNLSVDVDSSNDPLCSRSSLCLKDIPIVVDPDIQIQIPKLRNKKYLYRSKTAPAICTINEYDHPSMPRPSQLASPPIVRQSVVLLIMYLSLGVVIFWYNKENFIGSETHVVVDALYFCIVTMCTIGYGDIIPDSPVTKLFSIMFVLIGFGFIDILLSGMVSYVLDLQENYLLSSLTNGKKRKPPSYIIDFKKGRMRIRTKVGLALGVVVLCIGVGVGVLHFVEHLCWLDCFYLSVMSVTTVGYGDKAFSSTTGRVFASVWLLVSTLAVARAFLYLAEARVDKRHRRMVKWVLGQDLTVAQFLAADIDNNGSVR